MKVNYIRRQSIEERTQELVDKKFPVLQRYERMLKPKGGFDTLTYILSSAFLTNRYISYRASQRAMIQQKWRVASQDSSNDWETFFKLLPDAMNKRLLSKPLQ